MLTIRVTLREYIDSLRAAEKESRRALPAAQRRAASAVPSLRALARACGTDHSTMTLLAANERDNLALLGCAVWHLQQRGFPTTLNDVIELVPTATLSS